MTYIKLEDLQKFPIRQNHYDKENGNEHFICGIETVIEYAENLPAADVVEVKHAEWVHSNRGFNVQGDYECSNCHSPSGIKLFYNGDKYTYCPDCGARMDGGK